MEPHQPTISSASPVVISESTKLQTDSSAPQSDSIKDSEGKESLEGNLGDYVGILDVYIHQARDIHNICIYQNQDVYAKFCLTSDPEQIVSTRIIDGGGRNPVFNEIVQLNVRTVDSFLRCEVWMLSRVRNYLDDQLLGFTLVPLSDVLIENRKPAKEFSLSSSDLFHSPAGFVQLSLAYTGASPEVLEIPMRNCGSVVSLVEKDSGICGAISNELEKIEFPDPTIVNENECMVSNYLEITCPELEPKSTEQSVPSENHCQFSPQSHVGIQESMAVDGQGDNDVSIVEKPSTVVATKRSYSVSASGASNVPEFRKQDDISDLTVGNASEGEGKVKSTAPTAVPSQPAINVTLEPEQEVVQQDIVDMYMKSMQQFTEALSKMNLPLDIENDSSSSNAAGNAVISAASSEKAHASKDTEPSHRVFYGSRAFF